MSDPRSNNAHRLERIGALMHATAPATSRQEHLEGRARLLAAVDKMRKPAPASRVLGRTGVRFAAAFVAAAAIAAIVVAVVRPRLHAPLAWHVENGQVGAEGYVSIAATAPSARLVFDDGSDVGLDPGSRGRVASTTPSGAKVVLEHGRARVHVVHRDRTSWLVDAGPFAVHVTGTEFVVAWAADAETLDVWMHAGSVVVSGPVLGDAQPLSGGQHLRARLRDATVQLDNAPEPPASPVRSTAIQPSAPTPPPDPILDRAPVEAGGPRPPLPRPGRAR
jgi:ferric-dicitrate binding protein FerR (iron transport regulator)